MTAIPFRAANACMTLESFARPKAVQATSIGAYRSLVADGKASTQAGRLYRMLLAHPLGLSNQELSLYTGIRINAVCGRINELRKAGLVVCGGLRVNERTNVQNMVWVTAPAGGGV